MEDTVKTILYSFFSEMHEWENGNLILDDIARDWDSRYHEFVEKEKERWSLFLEIFAKYCIGSGEPARTRSYTSLFEYSVEHEFIDKIMFVDLDLAEVETTRRLRGVTERFKYTLSRHEGTWRIVDNRLEQNPDGSWFAAPL
ncbi:MAG: NTF2 fold immunity protein [Capsulimonadales bacterium]|nr:NTF2 fold immunity protein [Capsulimonadales bacterium]